MFAVAGILLTQTGLRDLKQMGGLAAKMPFTASLFVLGALILSAVPPTSGFQAEWTMFAGIFSQGASGSSYLAVALLGSDRHPAYRRLHFLAHQEDLLRGSAAHSR